MNMFSSKTLALGIVGGCIGTLFIGYCIYFDYKRHMDPNFKKKLYNKRQAKRLAIASEKQSKVHFPNMKDPEAVQRFFIQEIQLGEELIVSGDLENGVDHIANSMAVCGQPHELFKVLQVFLQPQALHLLTERLKILNIIRTKSTSE